MTAPNRLRMVFLLLKQQLNEFRRAVKNVYHTTDCSNFLDTGPQHLDDRFLRFRLLQLGFQGVDVSNRIQLLFILDVGIIQNGLLQIGQETGQVVLTTLRSPTTVTPRLS
jgi:hypothetical protein